jgi:hypothetical protein
MRKKNNAIKFGEDVQGYAVAVLNEREIRASAGIMFLVLLLSLMFILFEKNFLMVKYVILIFFTDFMIRVLISPKFSPLLIIGRMIVSRQLPEYVGAPQKKFAWIIGLALSGLMFLLMVILNSYSIITGLTCLVCLVFMFFESAFGICLGCLVYRMFHKNEALYCPGEICNPRKKQAIQKISGVQLFILLATIVSIVIIAMYFNDNFREPARNLKEVIGSL